MMSLQLLGRNSNSATIWTLEKRATLSVMQSAHATVCRNSPSGPTNISKSLTSGLPLVEQTAILEDGVSVRDGARCPSETEGNFLSCKD